jgi:hypothetical protein
VLPWPRPPPQRGTGQSLSLRASQRPPPTRLIALLLRPRTHPPRWDTAGPHALPGTPSTLGETGCPYSAHVSRSMPYVAQSPRGRSPVPRVETTHRLGTPRLAAHKTVRTCLPFPNPRQRRDASSPASWPLQEALVAPRGHCHGAVVCHTVQSALLPQEANFAVRIAAHQAHNHGFLFAALKPVHRPQLNAGIPFFEHSRNQGHLHPMSSVRVSMRRHRAFRYHMSCMVIALPGHCMG